MQPEDFQPTSSGLQYATLASSLSIASSPHLESTPSSHAFSIATVLVTSLLSASTSIPTATVTGFMNSTLASPKDGENNGECRLLGPFAVLVQAALGGLALLSLVYKRWRERPQRPIKIWAFDASKQVFGSVLLHLANLLMSMFSAGQLEESIAKAAVSTVGGDADDIQPPNPCSFYLLNLAIDTTLGIPILIFLLRLLSIAASYTPLANPPESIRSGNYGDPPKATWWLKQSMIYFIGLLCMKVCVFFIFQLCPWIVQVGDWALRWTEGNEAVQVAFVMLIFPLIMNAIQYYIIDTFIKKPIMEERSSTDYADADESEHGGLLADQRNERASSLDDNELDKSYEHRSKKPALQTPKDVSYDPDKDGETTSDRVEGSSSLGSNATEEAINRRPRI